MNKKRSVVQLSRSIIFNILLGYCLACGTYANGAGLPDRITIYDHEYELDLAENTELIEKLQFDRSESNGTHYRGKLLAHDDSWVRVSNIGGRWKGLVSFNGQMFTIAGSPEQSRYLAVAGSNGATILAAAPVANYEHFKCGIKGHAHRIFELPKHSALQSAVPVPLSTLCDQSLGIHCVFAEAEFVFDPAFQQAFPNDTDSEALAIINMVEGPYLNQMGIALDAVTIRTQGTSEFSTTTDAGILLDDILDKRVRGQISDDINNQSLFHFVTGRVFNDDTVGAAFINTLCTSSAVGASQVVSNQFGDRDTRLTAMVVAHEFGHNFGADHDVEDNSCGPGHIMDTIDQSGASFSTCSQAQIETAVSNVPNLPACFNFPMSLWSRAADTNVSSVAAGQVFTHDYEVEAREGYQSIETLSVAGALVSGQGQIEAATLDSLPCVISTGGTDYQCLRNDPGTTLALSYSVRHLGTSTELVVTNTLEAVGIADRDLALTNSILPVFDIRTRVDHATPFPASDLTALFYYEIAGSPIDLEWTDNSDDENAFRIERRLDGGAFEEIATTTWSDYRDLTAVEEGVRYEYRIVAFNAAGSASPSNIASGQLRVPDQISSLVAQLVNGSEIYLRWGGQLSNIEDGIRIERSVDNSGFVEIGSVGADVDEYIDVSAVFGSVNEYRVFAFNAAGDAPASNIASYTLGLVPNSVTGLSANQIADSSLVDITWIDSSDNEDGFRVERRSQGGVFEERDVVGANRFRFVDGGTQQGMTYEYRVIAFNSLGDSESNAIVNVTIEGIPAAASAVTASQVTGTNVTVRWADNSDNEQGFSILRSEGSSSFRLQMSAGTDSTSAIDSSAAVGLTYRYRVIAYNLAGESAASDSAPITVAGAPCCTSGGGGNGGGGGSMSWLLLLMMALPWLREASLTVRARC